MFVFPGFQYFFQNIFHVIFVINFDAMVDENELRATILHCDGHTITMGWLFCLGWSTEGSDILLTDHPIFFLSVMILNYEDCLKTLGQTSLKKDI